MHTRFVKYTGSARDVWKTSAARKAKQIEADLIKELGPVAKPVGRTGSRRKGKNAGMWEGTDPRYGTRNVYLSIVRNGKRTTLQRSIDKLGKRRAYDELRSIRDEARAQEA